METRKKQSTENFIKEIRRKARRTFSSEVANNAQAWLHYVYGRDFNLVEFEEEYLAGSEENSEGPTGTINHFNNNSLELLARPNPANETVIITLSGSLEFFGKIVLSDILGKKIGEERVDSHQIEVTFSTKELPNGIYFYSLQSQEQVVETKKLIIVH